MELAHFIGAMAAVLYLMTSTQAWQQMHTQRITKRLSFFVLGLVAVGLHSVFLWLQLVSPQGISLGFFPMASLVAGTGALIITFASLYRRLEWVSALVYPLSALSMLPLFWLAYTTPSQILLHGLGAHVVLSVLASAVFSIAAAQALVLLFQHKQLKRGRLQGALASFPPIQTSETMLFELLWASFAILTAAIVTGFIYVEDLFTQQVAHKTVLTLAAWLLLGVLLAGRHLFGWRALTAIHLTLIGFATLLLAFFGSQFVLEYLLAQ